LGVGEYIGQKFQLIKNTNISIEFISDLPVYTCIATEEEFDNYLEGENYFCVGGSVSDETTEDYSEGMLEAGNYVYLFDSNEKTEIKYELLIGILE